jgi:hypothetical protein
MTRRVFGGAAFALATGLLAAASAAMAPAGVAAETPRPATRPRHLSETGLYADAGTRRIDPANRPYAPQYPLWSDGAAKRRWVRLPPGTTIDVRNMDAWTFPVGTKFWKEFSFGERRVETRMLWKLSPARWAFASYVWNDAQTDAVLAPETGVAGVAGIAPGKRHSIPSVDDCRACHDSGRIDVLGFTALQLSTDRDPAALHADPLEPGMVTLATLVQERRLSPPSPDLVAHPPRIRAQDATTRALLGYLSANCGACHTAAGPLAKLGLDFRQPAYADDGLAVIADALDRTTKFDLPGLVPGTSRAVVAGQPSLSALLYRMRSRRPSSQMPPLGTVVTDRDAVNAVEAWIAALPPRSLVGQRSPDGDADDGGGGEPDADGHRDPERTSQQ